MTTTDTDWLEPWEAAAYLNMTEGAFRRLLRDGVIGHSKPGGKPKSRIRVRRQDLDALMAASRTEATTGPLATGGAR